MSKEPLFGTGERGWNKRLEKGVKKFLYRPDLYGRKPPELNQVGQPAQTQRRGPIGR